MRAEDLSVEGVGVVDYLKFKEMIYDEEWFASSSRNLFIALVKANV